MTTITRFLVIFCIAFAGTALAGPSVEDFFRHPQFRDLALSPDGSHIAATAPYNGRMNLVVLSLADRKPKLVTSESRFDVVSFHWVGNQRLVLSLGNINEPSGSDERQGGGLFAVDRDGTNSRVLAPTIAQQIARGERTLRSMNYVGPVAGSEDEVIVAANERSLAQFDLYRLDTRTARKTLLTHDNPGGISSWVLDTTGVPRAAVAGSSSTARVVWYRKDADSPWERIGGVPLFGQGMLPLAFGPDGRFYVISNAGRDKYAIFTYDLEARKLGELVHEHPDVDVGVNARGLDPDASRLVFDPDAKKLVGIRVEAEKPLVHWLDADWAKRHDAIARALPGQHVVFSPRRGGGRTMVRAYSDRVSSTWYLLDPATLKMEFMATARPWLKESDLVEMKPITFKARDGLVVPAYLFLPRGSEGKKLPLVVNIHGGPHVRADRWHLEMWGPMESQFLAHHGYAVLLTNFRMTPGFGHRFYTAGIRQMGLAMQEDLEDGVDHLVKLGVVDEKRVCLYGGSYGGYATLWGLVKTPDKYACGVGALVVSDRLLQITSPRTDYSSSKAAVAFWSRMAGNPETESEYLKSISPAFHADKIKAPLFIIAGEADRRTPLEQAEKMKAAMEAAGKTVEWMVKPEEGHGFAKLENRVDMYTKMLEFLNRHTAVKP